MKSFFMKYAGSVMLIDCDNLSAVIGMLTILLDLP